MSFSDSKNAIVARLRQEILSIQGYASGADHNAAKVGLGNIETAFPNGIFPRAAIHEFLIPDAEGYAASGGFITGILKTLLGNERACIWISSGRTIFPPALHFFGISPERVIFLDVQKDRDVLWAMEEGLKCEGLAAVIAEVGSVNFIQSRRLQLAVEQSKITGFLLRTDPKALRSACTARWRITSVPSQTPDGLPGVGYPRWQVALLKIKAGNPGEWVVEWKNNTFREVVPHQEEFTIDQQQFG